MNKPSKPLHLDRTMKPYGFLDQSEYNRARKALGGHGLPFFTSLHDDFIYIKRGEKGARSENMILNCGGFPVRQKRNKT